MTTSGLRHYTTPPDMRYVTLLMTSAMCASAHITPHIRIPNTTILPYYTPYVLYIPQNRPYLDPKYGLNRQYMVYTQYTTYPHMPLSVYLTN